MNASDPSPRYTGECAPLWHANAMIVRPAASPCQGQGNPSVWHAAHPLHAYDSTAPEALLGQQKTSLERR